MEPYFFSKLLRCYSYGTDISPTSEFFPNVEQHDFHKTLKSKVDIIFSNSYDQCSNPDALAEAWVDSINEKGLIVLQYGEGHKPGGINELDPFGVSKKAAYDLFNKVIQNKRIESSFLWVKDLPRQIKGNDEWFLIISKGYVLERGKCEKAIREAEKWIFENANMSEAYKQGRRIPIYSPYDTERRNDLNNDFVLQNSSQQLIAFALTWPNETAIKHIENMRKLMKMIYPGYSHEKLSKANTTQFNPKDLLKLIDDETKKESE